MARLLSLVGVIAALFLVIASSFMNFEYVSSWGKDPFNGHILGAVSVAFDIIKALLPFFVLWAWKNRRFLHVGIGSVLFVGLAGFSLLSALGFAASNRDFTMSNQNNITAQFQEIGEQLAARRKELSQQPAARTITIVEQAINAQKQHKRFITSKGCTDVTTAKSRAFCKEYFLLKAEYAAATERARLQAIIDGLAARRARLRGQGATQQSDPQAGLIAKLTGLKIENTQTALIVFVAVLVEFAAAFGLYLSTAHGGVKSMRTKSRNRKNRTRKAKVIPLKPAHKVRKEKQISSPEPKTAPAAPALLKPVARQEEEPVTLCPLEELKRQNLQLVVSL